MHLSKQQIEKFRVIYVKEFGKIITEEDALEMATRLIDLYLIIYRPLPARLRRQQKILLTELLPELSNNCQRGK